MAYTPTTWVAGDTVTATKLNKLEQGVANAGSGYPMAEITTSGFSSATQIAGPFAYAEPRQGGGYKFVNYLSTDFGSVEMYEGAKLVFFGDSTFKIIIPYVTSVGDCVLVFISDGDVFSNFGGGISSTPVNVYRSNGDSFIGYIITGDFSVTINNS